MSEEFKVLSDREHCLTRPAMYIGSVAEESIAGIIDFKQQSKTIVPGLIKIVEEILNNSIDEWIRTSGKFANKIDVTIINTIDGAEVTVSDNGRGIPVEKVGDSYRPVLAWTQLRAGSNFSDDKRITAGTNGVGSSLSNIFSTSFTGVADDGKKRLILDCTDNMSTIKHRVISSKQQGTTVKFLPDLSRFGLKTFTQDHIDVIRDRLMNMSILYQDGIQFTFNGEKIGFKNLKTVAKLFHEDSVSYSQDNVMMVFAPSGANEEFLCHSYVNAIYIKNGGSHVDYVLGKVVESLRESIQKKHKISVLPNQIKQHLLFASWINGFVNLKFDSQTKERITNSQSEVASVLGSIDFEKIAKQILNTPSIVDPMIAAILYKKELADKLALQKLQKEQSKTNLRKITKFTDATCQNRDDAILCVVEGLSAANSVLSARTPNIGCYPLKGKMINAMDATMKELMANAEFVDLLAITGLKVGEDPSMRFGKIAITTDADSDGNHCAGLFIAAIRKYWPKLIEQGKIFRFVTPIMKIVIGKNEQYFYSLDEFASWSDKNRGKKYVARYLKGLGSSTAQDFRTYFGDMERHLVQIRMDESTDLEIVDLVFGKGIGMADKRKIWLDLED